MDEPTQSQPLPVPIRRFLEVPRYATIATLLPNGTPHQAVVWYDLRGESVMINSRRGRRWPANLERDSRIGIAVYDDANPDHWVGLRGVAEVLRSGPTAVADIEDLARRYEGNPADFAGQDRITFLVRIQRAFEYGDVE